VSSRPVLANSGAMSTFVGAFEVTSKLTGNVFQCRFFTHVERHSHAPRGHHRHEFFVDGKALVLGLSHKAFVKISRARRTRLDRPRSELIAADFLSERLEEEDETSTLRCVGS